MDDAEKRAAVKRLWLTFDLFETGLRMRQAQLRRLHPDETADQLELRLREWLQERPGAPHGDAPGRPLDVSRYQ